MLDVKDLVPPEFRESAVTTYLPRTGTSTGDTAVQDWDLAWREDEFVLDPTRATLYLGRTGMNGFDFREQILMNRFGIQINKTSINSVLLIFTIGVTWSSLQYLLDALRRTAVGLARAVDGASRADRLLMRRRTKALTSGLPSLPDVSAFDAAFRPSAVTTEGDMRAAVYTAYEEANREYVPLANASTAMASGRRLVSATFVVPYPPGFPVLVPGQLVSTEILNFLTKLDVKEVHGYRAELGLCVFSETSLQRYAADHGRDRRALPKPAPTGSDPAADTAPDTDWAAAARPVRADPDQNPLTQSLAARVAGAVGDQSSGGRTSPGRGGRTPRLRTP